MKDYTVFKIVFQSLFVWYRKIKHAAMLSGGKKHEDKSVYTQMV